MSSDLCRLCLGNENLAPIFVDKQQSETYTTVLSITTGLNIEPNDGYPQQICNKCTDLVNSALHLRNLSHKSDSKLRNTEKHLEQIDTIVTDDNFSKDNVNLVEEGIDNTLPNFEVEIQCDRLTDDNENGGNSTVKDECTQPFGIKKEKGKGMSRKEKKAMYMSLVDGVLNPKGPVKCKVCKKTVSKWSCFISHAKLHLGFKFMCEYCGKSFISSTQLKRHCRSYHGMKRELACKHCSYLALDNAQLLLHERRVHTGERPYVCDICAASYFSRRCLVQHLESHRTLATFQCSECEQSFKSRRHLARHKYSRHAPERRARCPHCLHIYCRKYLSAHISKHHTLATKDNCS